MKVTTFFELYTGGSATTEAKLLNVVDGALLVAVLAGYAGSGTVAVQLQSSMKAAADFVNPGSPINFTGNGQNFTAYVWPTGGLKPYVRIALTRPGGVTGMTLTVKVITKDQLRSEPLHVHA